MCAQQTSLEGIPSVLQYRVHTHPSSTPWLKVRHFQGAPVQNQMGGVVHRLDGFTTNCAGNNIALRVQPLSCSNAGELRLRGEQHTGCPLPMEGFEVQYLHEKLDCIFDGRIIATEKQNAPSPCG
jgi:hypothetical protein